MKAEAVLSKEFVLSDGKKISEPSELLKELENMNERVFRAHVSDIHNDFADWLEDAHGERMLANELRVACNNVELMETLQRYLNRPQKKSESDTIEVSEQHGSEVIEDLQNTVADSPMVDYHEDLAPTMQSEIHNASEVAEDPQTIEAATIVPQANLVIDDPSKAPVIEFGTEKVDDGAETASSSNAEISFSTELPALGITLPGPKIGINKMANPFVLHVMLIYRYLLMILTLGRFKLEPVEEKQQLTPQIPAQPQPISNS